MDNTFFDGLDELYHHAKLGEDRTMRAGCSFENVVLVFLLLFFVFFCRAPSPERRAFQGCIFRTSIALPIIGRFRRGFQRFFLKGLLLQMHYVVLIFVGRWHQKFREMAVKNCENSKNLRKSLCEPLCIDR